MNNLDFNIVCPDCEKKIHICGTLEVKSLSTSGIAPTKFKKQKKKSVAKKKTPAKKKAPKKGKYDKDLEKLFKLNAGAPTENFELAPTEAGNSAAALQRMSEAAKKYKKDIKNLPSLEKKIQDWLSGGSNPFSE